MLHDRLQYVADKAFRLGVDLDFEADLRAHAKRVATRALSVPAYRSVRFESLDVSDGSRFAIVRPDIYRRFVVDATGSEFDAFGRQGRWVPRGATVYHDAAEGRHVKIFDPYFCELGEGRFLGDALERGQYVDLCPGLAYVVHDGHGRIRGYAIDDGMPLSRYQFERYVGVCLRDLICDVTRRTGLYFRDLTYHNAVRIGDALSLIDLDGVLPVGWFETDAAFAYDHLDTVDIGWPIQNNWTSPRWYRDFLRSLIATYEDPS